MGLLVDVDELTSLLKMPPDSLDEDEYTRLIMEAASAKVRDVAGHPEWELDTIPTRGRFIALWLAKRAWEDPGNLQRRTSGPISDTFFENGVRGLTLEDDEREWLEGQQPGGANSTWILRHYGTGVSRRPFGDETPDGYSFAGGDMNFSHGLDMTGPARADNW